MYSVVLATMLMAGGEAPTWHHHSCCSCYCSCSCSGYHGHGWHSYCSCSGCWGCSCYCSGCWGCSCYCSGWCSGYCSCSCWGYSYYSSCSCYCSGYCSCSCFGFCSGGGVVVAAPYCSCSGYCSCSCSCSCLGGVYSVPAGTAPAGGPEQVPVAPSKVGSMPSADGTLQPRSEAEREAVRKLLDKMRATKKVSQEEEVRQPAPARLTVKLPADARLWVDNVECPLSTAERRFNTPALQPGQTYYYTLKMQVQRQGQPVTESQRVLVSAGRSVSVTFADPAVVATAQR